MQTRTLLSLCGLAAALTALPTAHAVPKYAKLIPNGSGVAGVTALGHTDPESGGATNAFGKAFAAAGNAWNEALCKADSDGDGQTNGEELGDPCCKWTAGATPAVASGAKDPGSASSKLDDAALTAAKALCGGAAPAASSAAPASAPGTVKPADGASNATPALTPGTPAAAPAAAPAAGTTPAAATTAPAAATPGAAAAGTTSGSDGYDWVPIDQMNKTTTSSSKSGSATTPSASTAASNSSATNSSKNATSAAAGGPLGQRGASLLQVVAAAVVGVVALAL